MSEAQDMPFDDDNSFAQRLQWLYDNVPDPRDRVGKHTFSDTSLAARICEIMPDFSVTPATLWNLRRGVHKNPSWNLVRGIAKAFGRTPLFFTEDNAIDRTQEELALLAAMQRAGVRDLLLRAADLPEDSLQSITTIVDQVHKVIVEQRSLSREARKELKDS